MIFVSVGTERWPFDRLLEALDRAAGAGAIKEEIFAQIGASTYTPKNFKFERLLSFEQMVNMIKRADLIVAHAGAGTVLLSLLHGKIPIIMPRRLGFGEHLDDHQADFAEKMEGIGRSVVARDEEELMEKIRDYKEILPGLGSRAGDGSDPLVGCLLESCR